MFEADPEGKCIAIVESLRLNNANLNNTLDSNLKSLTWKAQAVVAAYKVF